MEINAPVEVVAGEHPSSGSDSRWYEYAFNSSIDITLRMMNAKSDKTVYHPT